MIPIIGLVGTSNSGKTTLLVKLIRELKARGFKVATIKHHNHDIEIDTPGKDTWKHAQAGADQVAFITSNKAAIFYQGEISLHEVLKKIVDVDLVLIEGFKYSSFPQIEVVRGEVRTQLISNLDNLIAVASDLDFPNVKVPVININDISSLANLIERQFLRN